VVAGRNVHPTTTSSRIPQDSSKKTWKNWQNSSKNRKIRRTRPETSRRPEYPELKVDLEFIAQNGDELFPARKKKLLSRIIRKTLKRKYGTTPPPNSAVTKNAPFCRLSARLIIRNKTADEILDYENLSHNLAQAIEILEYHKKAGELIESY